MPVNSNFGKFIVIDGIDIEARKFIVKEISRWLTENGIKNIELCDPTGNDPVNEDLQASVTKNLNEISNFDKMAFEFLMRKRYLSNTVNKALQTYYWVVCDGFMDSVYADYSTSSGIVHSDIVELEDLFLEGLLSPDEVIIVDTPLSMAHKRLVNNQLNSVITLREFEKVYRASYQRKRTEFLIRATAQRHNHHVVEGDMDLMLMAQQAKNILDGRLKIEKTPSNSSIY